MVIKCIEVIRAVSDYVESDLTPELRQAIEEHLRGCNHCSAAYDGVRNVLRLVADDRVLELPAGFGQRLRERLRAFR